MSKIEKIKLEERMKYLKEQYDEMKMTTGKNQEGFDKKVNDKQMEIWKQQMTVRSMVQQMSSMS